MKKQNLKKYLPVILIVILAAAAGLMFCLKKGGAEETDSQEEEAVAYTYPMEQVTTFCVGEDNILYLVRKKENVITAYDEEGKQIADYPVEADGVTEILNYRMREDGTKQSVEDELTGLCYQNGKVYCYRNSTAALMCLDTADGNVEVVWQGEELVKLLERNEWEKYEAENRIVKDMAVCGDIVLALISGRYEEKDAQVSYTSYADNKEYIYSGERIGIWNLSEGTWDLLDYRNLVAISARGSEGFWVEGYDEALHYYVAELTPDGKMGERYPTEAYSAWLITWDEEMGMLHAATEYATQAQCFSGTPAAMKSAYRYYSNALQTRMIRSAADSVYLLQQTETGESGQIVRLEPKKFFKESRPLKAYVLNLSQEPDWQGYPVEVERLSREELVLKLLAEDSDFDFVVLSTSMPEAWNMKRVMAYYPLNEVLGESLEKCFPGVREAAYQGEEIWMLPLGMDINALVYSEENLKAAGTTMEGVKTVKQLCALVEHLENVGCRELYSFMGARVRDFLMEDYVSRQLTGGMVSFQTEEFEMLLEDISSMMEQPGILESGALSYPWERYEGLEEEKREEYLAEGKDWLAAQNMAALAAEEVFYQEIMLQFVERRSELEKYEGREEYRVIPMPGVVAGQECYLADMDILVVNPSSANREAALQLVKKMAAAELGAPENYLTADRESYSEDAFSQSLYEYMTKVAICEMLPAELYEEYYAKYFSGQLEKEEMQKEMERVINAYYFE